jgi:TIR domain-containing protein
MKKDMEYDVFFSFALNDKKIAKPMYEEMLNYGFRVFYSDEIFKGKAGSNWSKDISDALINSQNFVLLWTPEAMKAPWVTTEYTTFYNACHIREPEARLMCVIKGKSVKEEIIPPFLRNLQSSSSIKEVIQRLYKKTIEIAENEKKILRDELFYLNKKFKDEQKHFLYTKFWSPIVNEHQREIHIITCARDMAENENRGQGGRTNIDKWDYTTVLEITHFLALKYPQTKVNIEPPTSKLSTIEINHFGKMKLRDNLIGNLRNKNCIIIGSPDVSDFAEVILAKLHDIEPYIKERKKSKGYVIIKNKQHSESSFYWQRKDKESEGVAKIIDLNQKEFEYFPLKIANNEGTMYGVLTVANNPFVDEKISKKILILSGFSGIATYAIAKLLTDDRYQDQLSIFDKDFTDKNKNIEALIGLNYTIDEKLSNKDNRNIGKSNEDIFYTGYVEI